MSERNWTAGPWVVEQDPIHGDCRVIAQTNPTKKGRDMGATWVIADDIVAFRDPEEQLEHAHLIAAAPELFEALEHASQVLRDVAEVSGVTHSDAESCADTADSALAKAKGEQA